ncbi:OmpA family protein [Pontivivens insulae]|uniref:Peptidoglycan-binding protein ArfA n=1 Tax=Pontivivens insulae TaxID=1639689 RepID=A0A2R8A6D0_9RHOB|nr:OmpA family protein [Pontivivens insulae]RED17904.1 OOP family OmpA-OmpF porin [Pontivivens insulae]SPF27794.1 Peptidoglycan-binding protein ArfA [Pontivivens insulae]
MRIAAYLFLILSFAGAAAGAWWLSDQAAREIEDQTRNTVVNGLSAAAQDWPDIAVDGTRVTLSGAAPSEAAGFRALEVARGIVGAQRIENRIILTATDAAEAVSPLGMTIILNPAEITVLGTVPDGSLATVEVFAERSTRPVSILAESVDRDEPAAWTFNLLAALDVAPLMQTGRITFGPRGAAVIEAALADAATRDAIERRVRAAAPPGTAVTLELAAPPRTLAPFPFLANKNADGLTIETCAVPDNASLGRIAMITSEADAECRLALGAPEGWADALTVALPALNALPSGSLSLQSMVVTLKIGARTADVLADAVIADLAEALPDGFTLVIEEQTLPEPESIPQAVSAARPFTVTRADGVVTVEGSLSDDAAVEAVLSYASSAFPGVTLETELATQGEGQPTTVASAIAAVEAVTLMLNGSAIAERGTLVIEGAAPGEGIADQIAEALAARLPQDTTITIDIEEIQPQDVEQIIAPSADPDLCLEEVQAIQTPGARIGFAPSSANLDLSSAPVLDALSTRLRECPELNFIIAGYTDNQGREELNQRISESRANAVLDALLARGVFLDRMRAVGLGEADPVADNDTPEGRALNRRIEFLSEDAIPLPPDETDAPPEEVTE